MLAINIDEYVPISIPIIIAKANNSTADPPNKNKEIRTNIVVKEVISVLDNVWLIELLRIFSYKSVFTILVFSLILS